jgi:hypothetical protein
MVTAAIVPAIMIKKAAGLAKAIRGTPLKTIPTPTAKKASMIPIIDVLSMRPHLSHLPLNKCLLKDSFSFYFDIFPDFLSVSLN